MNVIEAIKELGLGILRNHTNAEPIGKEVFLEKWRDAVGDTFADRVELKLLAVSGVVPSIIHLLPTPLEDESNANLLHRVITSKRAPPSGSKKPWYTSLHPPCQPTQPLASRTSS